MVLTLSPNIFLTIYRVLLLRVKSSFLYCVRLCPRKGEHFKFIDNLKRIDWLTAFLSLERRAAGKSFYIE